MKRPATFSQQPQRRVLKNNRSNNRPVRTSTKPSLKPTVSQNSETLEQQDVELHLSTGKRQHQSVGSIGISTNQSNRSFLQDSSLDVSGADGEVARTRTRQVQNLRSLNLDSANNKPTLISPLGFSTTSNLNGEDSAFIGTPVASALMVNDSCIDRRIYGSVQYQPSSAQTPQLGDNLLSSVHNGRNRHSNPFGVKMDVLSMEKVFSDPSFHEIYEKYSKSRERGSHQFTNQAGSPNHPEISRILPSKTNKERLFAKAVREQIPNHLAILDTEVLSLLTDTVLQQNPLLQKLHEASFRRKSDGTKEILSVVDLGLEKKDHQFLTETWLNLSKFSDICADIYNLINTSDCDCSTFINNIKTFMSYAVDQGLKLATILIKTATFLAATDDQAKNLLKYQQQVRQLTESLNSYADLLENIRELLMKNFSVIPLVSDS